MYATQPAGADVVLGMQWRKVRLIYERYLEWIENGRVILGTAGNASTSSPSSPTIVKGRTREGRSALLSVYLRPGVCGSDICYGGYGAFGAECSPGTPAYHWQACLNNNRVFQEPPPYYYYSHLREHDHAIESIPGSQPPNIRPYRYPYEQKSEIEKLALIRIVGNVGSRNHSAQHQSIFLTSNDSTEEAWFMEDVPRFPGAQQDHY